MERDEFGEALGFERAGVGDEVHAFDDREPEGDGAAEGMEKRQAAEDGGAGGQIEAGAELRDVRKHVAVAERHAFRFAGGAGGEEQGGLVIAAAFDAGRGRAPSTAVGRILEITAQVTIFFLRAGSVRSIRIRSRFGGQGKVETLRTKGSAVMKRSTPAWRMHERMASGPAVKLRFTGVFPAKSTARLAMSPAFPGGSTMATRGWSVSALRNLEKTMAAARILS